MWGYLSRDRGARELAGQMIRKRMGLYDGTMQTSNTPGPLQYSPGLPDGGCRVSCAMFRTKVGVVHGPGRFESQHGPGHASLNQLTRMILLDLPGLFGLATVTVGITTGLLTLSLGVPNWVQDAVTGLTMLMTVRPTQSCRLGVGGM